jgi:hypothetical protein
MATGIDTQPREDPRSWEMQLPHDAAAALRAYLDGYLEGFNSRHLQGRAQDDKRGVRVGAELVLADLRGWLALLDEAILCECDAVPAGAHSWDCPVTTSREDAEEEGK